MDPAQVGASCQTLGTSFNAATGSISTNFSVLYGPAPFTIVENYDQHDQNVKGVFSKHVEVPFGIPGGSLIRLPTAVVDAQLASDASRYESVVLHSCYGVLVSSVSE